MQNVTTEVKGNKLVITVDLSVAGTPSASGKSTVIASTRGNFAVPGTGGKSGVLCKLGLNLYR